MEATTVIRRPLLSEKATASNEAANQYVFEIDRRATKTDVKNAIQAIDKVRVLAVQTQNRRGRDRIYKFGLVPAKVTKRAIVRIHPEDKIELF